MSKTAFTPGPWKVGPVDDTVVTASDGSEVAAIDGDYNQPDTWPIMEANARLIAAAPEMYAALTAIIDEIEDKNTIDAVMIARAALTKAAGHSREGGGR